MEELVKVISNIQYSNYMGDKGFLCKAVQEYYKILESAQVVKAKPKQAKQVEELIEAVEKEEVVKKAKKAKKSTPKVIIGEQGE